MNRGAGRLTVQVGRRDFSGPLRLSGVGWKVASMTWRAMGGPWTAVVQVFAHGASDLWGLARLLRCPVTIRDGLGPAWWGYIHTVKIQEGTRVVRLSLDEMANSLSVAYRDFSPTQPGGEGEQMLTPWISDAESAALYGLKQEIHALGPGLLEDAQACAATLLRQHRRPRITAGQARATTVITALLECRGWWETLDWQFYQDLRGHIAHRLSGAGQPIGSDAACLKVAQPLLLTAAQACELGELWFRLRKAGGPADALRAEVRRDASGVPGVLLAAAEVPCGAVGADWDWLRFAFDPAPALPAGETLWLVLSRTGAPDAAHHGLCSADEGPDLPYAPLLCWDGAAWSARGPAANLSFILRGVEQTTAQIAHMLASPCGQFFSGARVEAASGVQSWVYRAGGERGRAEVERLLRIGTADGVPLMARVEVDRTVRVFPQPPLEDAGLGFGGLKFNQGGMIVRADGRRLLPSEWPAGRWVRLGELSAAGSLVGGDAATWIDCCAWVDNRFYGVIDE